MIDLKKKMKYITIGYFFVMLNIIALSYELSSVGVIFGIISFYFFIKSLLIKQE